MNPAVTLAYALTLRITFHEGDSLYTRLSLVHSYSYQTTDGKLFRPAGKGAELKTGREWLW